MKKFLLLLTSVLFTASVFAQLKLTEQFSEPFTSSGNLGTQNAWVQSGSGTDVQVNYRSDNTGALTYPDYTSGRTSVSVARYTTGGGANGIDPYKLFNAAIPTSAENVLYISFVINVSAAQNTGDYCLALRSSGGNYFGRFAVRNNGTSVNFGVETNGTSFQWTGNFSYNTNYYIIMRYNNPTGNNNDDVYLWVNPSTLAEPTLGSANAFIENSGDNWGSSTIASLALLQNGSNACNAQIDAIRVAQGTGQASLTANAAAAWGNLAPQGTPLPVKFGNITINERTDGMLINWAAYSETEVDRYIVERSVNGRDFSRIGEVLALNNATETRYDFLDTAPFSGTSFYRIINLDRNGKKGFSNIVRVNIGSLDDALTLYPNPVRGGGAISYTSSGLMKGNYSARILNAAGQQVYNQRFAHMGGAINQTIQLPAAVRSGYYSLVLENEGSNKVIKTFIVQ